MQHRVVLVEDDERLGRQVSHSLEEAGYATTWLRDGARATPEALGDASLVLPTYRAWLGIVARHGDSPDVSALTDPERDVLELWQAAESAAITAAFGPHRYLDEAWFEIRL